MGKLAAYEKQMLASPDGQISLTDPDSRSMATSGRGSSVVGYNVQVAVDTVSVQSDARHEYRRHRGVAGSDQSVSVETPLRADLEPDPAQHSPW
jgi:hypothetical protein